MKKWQIQAKSENHDFWYTLGEADDLGGAQRIAQRYSWRTIRIMHRNLMAAK